VSATPLRALLAVLLVGACSRSEPAPTVSPRTVTYFVAAEPAEWNYAPLGRDPTFNRPLEQPWGARLRYAKLRYFQYTDDSFTRRVAAPAWAGILGPTLRAVVGDTLKVVFLNRTDRPLSLHPHGVKYTQENEGARYEPGADARGSVPAGARWTYTWAVDENAGPTPAEPSSKVWLYHSHVVADEEIYRGLVGTIVVTDRHRARPDRRPADVDREFTTLFMVWNENDHHTPDDQKEANLKHGINGLLFGNLQGLEMKVGERVRWYIVALGTEVDLHTAHWHGETVTGETGMRTDVVELMPASMRVVDMVPDNPGTWLFHCHVADHMMAGMYTTYTVLPPDDPKVVARVQKRAEAMKLMHEARAQP
jgi:FtsP/CotA-like multicopper oxidase with cupredoxin domain